MESGVSSIQGRSSRRGTTHNTFTGATTIGSAPAARRSEAVLSALVESHGELVTDRKGDTNDKNILSVCSHVSAIPADSRLFIRRGV